MMLFAIDIDGTIAGGNVRKYVHECNETLQLGLSADCLNGICTYKEFYALPEVSALQSDEPAWLRLKWVDFSAAVLYSLPVLPGAIEGVARLAQYGTVAYYTARKSSDLQKSQEMAAVTALWLSNHRFPGAAVFCQRVKGKLRMLSETTHECIVLIDDLCHRIIEEVGDPEFEALRRRLTLVAFGVADSPECSGGLQTFALKSWRDVDRLLSSLQLVQEGATQ